MRKKILVLIFVFLFAISTMACSDKDAENNANLSEELDSEEEFDSEIPESNDSIEDEEDTASSDLVGCGEIYSQGDMSYSVIGVRMEEVEGQKQLVLKMEAYNSNVDHFDFNPLMNVELFDNNGNEANLELMSPAYKEDVLSGVVLGGGNKRMGEIAFDISETNSDEYILQLGTMMGKEDAIKITLDNLDKTYEEFFENSGVTSEYSIGDTIEFENVSITFDGVRIEPKNTYNSNYDEEGMGLMVLDMTMVNNSDKSIEFVSVSSLSTIRQVCAVDGTELKYEDYSYQNRNWVESGETKSETFGLYYDETVKDFYVVLSTDLVNRTSVEILTFSIE